jgi:hypothetical protein
MRFRVATVGLIMAIGVQPGTAGAEAPFDNASNRALVTKHLELMNAGDWSGAAQMFAPDVRHHLGSWQSGRDRVVQGRESLTANLEDIFRTFPDWKMEMSTW